MPTVSNVPVTLSSFWRFFTSGNGCSREPASILSRVDYFGLLGVRQLAVMVMAVATAEHSETFYAPTRTVYFPR